MNKWGECSDVSICSCKKDWKQCEIWGELIELCGLNSNIPMIRKYKKLFSWIRQSQGEDSIIVDSSKSLSTLKMLLGNCSDLEISRSDILVIFTIKDVRSFVASRMNKNDAQRSFANIFRDFNYWLGANKGILDYINDNSIAACINLYENLCSDPINFFNSQLNRAGILEKHSDLDINENTSHIAMGNKNFVMRNRDQIIYDLRWIYDDKINLVYLAHTKARTFNKYLYSLLKSEGAFQSAPNG